MRNLLGLSDLAILISEGKTEFKRKNNWVGQIVRRTNIGIFLMKFP